MYTNFEHTYPQAPVQATRSSMNNSYIPEGVRMSAEEEDSPLFKTDDFRIWCMKVIPCTKRFVHDWTVCPFAHAGEKAVRRDPRTHSYTGIACPDMKKSSACIRGDRCPYAHNVFEYWLHPTRYRTQLCNDGPGCRRGICFFAHSLDELRVPACKPYVSPEALARASLDAIHQNPHPLDAQLSSPSMQQQQQQQASAAHAQGVYTQQQAALAALNAPSCLFDGPQITNEDNTYGSLHLHGAPPRLSTDYGHLPRWSDCPPLRASCPPGSGGINNYHIPSSDNSTYSTYPDARRFSHQSEYYSTSSTPPRLSSDSQQHYSGSGGGGGGGGSGGGGGVRGTEDAGTGGASYETAGRWSAGSSAGTASDSEGIDGDLAQSLATLKIAMTQQNSGGTGSGTSNHEVVINTLHQILMEAVASKGPSGGNTTTGNGSSTLELSQAQLAEYAAAITAQANDFSRSLSDGASDASSRLSLEVRSVGSPQSTSLDGGVMTPHAAGGSQLNLAASSELYNHA